MKNFFGYCIPVALLGFCLTIVLGLVFGEAGWVIAGFLAICALIAIGICVYQKLADIEEKLNSKKIEDKNEFAEEVKHICMYCFWSKCEWEIILKEWIGGDNPKQKKVAKEQAKAIEEVKEDKKEINENDLAVLEKLATLKSEGVITEEEFIAKKKEILGL